jgi:MoxR-like ATPase
MAAALRDLKTLGYSTSRVSLYESFLTAKRLQALGVASPAIADVDSAVADLFVLDPDNGLGRLYPFRYDWRSPSASGRKTVWNNTTRGPKLATQIFNSDDLRNGLKANAAAVVAGALSGDPLPAKQALAVLALRDHNFATGDDWSVAEEALRQALNLSPDELDAITDDRALGVPLLDSTEWSVDRLEEDLGPPGAAAAVGAGGASTEVVIDARVERMLRTSLRRYPCILLVGPPGTGKGALVRWLIALAESDPPALGFEASLSPNAMWRTPDESWSAFELVGGLAPDEAGYLRWANGLLLDALGEGRWLVLDETNRADLDKIMGPLLTWLSDQDVEVGRTKPHGGDPIVLGWSSDHACVADNAVDGHPTRYLAGSDWRLLGTYNPQDAQRVFRMGQALSRRFVVIPIPALKPGQFEKLLDDTYTGLPDTARESLVALYAAHYSAPETLLGPAVFLRLTRYLEGVADEELADHVAEAYVVNVGKFLAAFDDETFDQLRSRVVDEEQAITSEQWEWIATQRQTIG